LSRPQAFTTNHGMANGVYSYFEHGADIGVRGQGQTLEDAFTGAAAAVFAIMTDLSRVRAERVVGLQFEEEDEELALVVWLNLLLGCAREQRMVFRDFRLQRDGRNWQGEAAGERWREGLARGTEVKGATLTMLSCSRHGDGWEAACVVDV
jgi:SHS2 domain-containing protein